MEDTREHRQGTPDALQDSEGEGLNHSEQPHMEESDSDDYKRQQIINFLNMSLSVLDKVEILHRFLLKDKLQNSELIDLGDLASDVLEIPSSFFSDTLGGGATPTLQLTGFSKFYTICTALDEVELIPPQKESIEECLNCAGITEEELVRKNRFRQHRIKAVINTTVKGDTGGLLIDKLLQYRRDQQWLLQSNALWVYAHTQSDEYIGINEVCRKPYEDAIGGIIRETLQRTKDGQRVRQALDDATAFATRVLAKKNGQVAISSQKDECKKTDYNCKSLETYVAISLDEHMRNLATLQKNIFNDTRIICDSIGASSRNIDGIINTIQSGDDDSEIRSLLDQLRTRLTAIESKWGGTVYESLQKEASKVNQNDKKIFEKGPEDLLACVTSLVDNTFVLLSKTRVINSMRPLSDKVSNPLLCFSEKLYNIMSRAHAEEEDFLTEAKKFAVLYRDIRSEFIRKFGKKFADDKNGFNHQTPHSAVTSEGAETPTPTRVSEGRAASTSPSMGRRPQFFVSSGGTEGISPNASPRGVVVGAKVSPRNGKSSSQSTSTTGSPRTPISGSPREATKQGSNKIVAPPLMSDGGTSQGSNRIGAPPQIREGSQRRKAISNSRKSGTLDLTTFEAPTTAEQILVTGIRTSKEFK